MHLMNEPGKAGPETVSSLQELINEFPYFQSAHLLLARTMKEQEHIRYERQLKLAAAYAPDRKVLFSLIHKLNDAVQAEPILIEKVPSPFILEEEKKEDSVEAEMLSAEDEINPFIESTTNETKATANRTENITEAVQDFSFEKPYEPPYAIEPDESPMTEIASKHLSEQSTGETLSTDPREVLKRRLAEILGNPVSEEEESPTSSNVVPTPEIIREKVETDKQAPEMSKSAEEIVSEPEKPSSELASEILLGTLSNMPEPPVEAEIKSDSLADLLPEDKSKPLDTVEKLELEYAMEESVLSSLEDLPIIEVKEPEQVKEIIQETHYSESPKDLVEIPFEIESDDAPRTFIAWLSKLNKGDFGKVEEVHADDSDQHVAAKLTESSELPDGTIEYDSELTSEKGPQVQIKPETPVNPQKKELIDRFIATEPKIVPSKIEFYSPVKQAKRSIEEYDDVVSETLANIYKQQGNMLKARFCYEKLSLFYPEKRTYFAALIKEIDEELNRTNQEDL